MQLQNSCCRSLDRNFRDRIWHLSSLRVLPRLLKTQIAFVNVPPNVAITSDSFTALLNPLSDKGPCFHFFYSADTKIVWRIAAIVVRGKLVDYL